jgi:hypothetical protein
MAGIDENANACPYDLDAERMSIGDRKESGNVNPGQERAFVIQMHAELA